ncbi:MAG: cell division protein FtsB [Gammaproteobacteria bacterium]|nr:MAG: cell division protein FtsB [Gammaproteobacteria bacterium]
MNAFKWIWTVQVVLIIVLQFRLWAGEGSFAQMTMLQKEIDQQQQINDKLADRNAVLAAEVKSLKSGFDAIEENARYQLGMVKKNETFFLVVDS